MTDNGKSISKGDILVALNTHGYVTKGKEYSVFDVNYEHKFFTLQNDTGDYSCYYFSHIGEKLKLKEKSLVGRYLKALCDRPNCAGCYKEGDYIEIIKDGFTGSVRCNETMEFGQGSYDWKSSNVELMPEGFEPSEDMAINIYMEQELKFRDEFQKELNEIDDKEGEGIVDIFKAAGINPKPVQYDIGIDTFERAEANMTKEELLACVRFNIDKYTWRKKGQDEDDFKKIIDYCNYALKQLNK